MLSYAELFNQAYMTMMSRNWDTLYVALDVHGTIIPLSYKFDEDPVVYPHAIETLQKMSKMPNVRIILFTSSYVDHTESFVKFLKNHRVKIDFVNGNREVGNTETGCFTRKFFYSILIDDKAGFDPLKDWVEVNKALDIFKN